MSESTAIQTVKRDDLLRDLRALGVTPGMVLCVHSSLRSLGWVEGGASTVIAALMCAVGPEGSLVMPHYRLTRPVTLSDADRAAGLAWAVRLLPWSDREAHTGMGVIADTFAQRTDVARGPQRVHTLVAWGRGAGRLCQGWDPLIAAGGYVLLLGVGTDRCSVLHAAEGRVRLPETIAGRAYPPLPIEIAARYPETEYAVGTAGAHFDFLAIGRMADEHGLLRHGQVAAAPAVLAVAEPLVALYESTLREHPERLLFAPPASAAPDTGGG